MADITFVKSINGSLIDIYLTNKISSFDRIVARV